MLVYGSTAALVLKNDVDQALRDKLGYYMTYGIIGVLLLIFINLFITNLTNLATFLNSVLSKPGVHPEQYIVKNKAIKDASPDDSMK